MRVLDICPRKADWETLTVGVKSGAVPVRIVGEVCQPLGDPGVIKVDHRELRSAAFHQRLAHLLDIKLLLLGGFNNTVMEAGGLYLT